MCLPFTRIMADGDFNAPWNHLLRIAESEWTRLHAELPADVRAAIADVAVLFEEFPDRNDLDPDLLGFFEGSPAGETETGLPGRITLWLGNLWDFSNAQEAVFRDETRITLLHEIGHALGWDEDEIAARGLA